MGTEHWTLNDVWEIYKRDVLDSKACLENDSANWRKHIAPFLGNYLLADVRNQQIAEFRSRLEDKPITPQTVKHCLALVKRILRRALEWEI